MSYCIAFRVDASQRIGAGHVSRCMVLAEELRSWGHSVFFITRELRGNIDYKIKAKGFEVFTRESDVSDSEELNLARDLSYTIEILKRRRVDILVVDNYELDYKWESVVKRYVVSKVVVIDDLADRMHECDVLIDQSPGRSAKDYIDLVPPTCELLAGSSFVVLRREFDVLREKSLTRRDDPVIKNILVTLGSTDPQNFTKRVLLELKDWLNHGDISVKVVLGHEAPHIQSLRELIKTLSFDVELLLGVDNIAELMTNADIAIGGAGTTSLERAYLGLPSILVIQAKNQRVLARELTSAGATLVAAETVGQLIKHLSTINPKTLKRMSLCGSELIDGMGRYRICKAITQNLICSVLPASMKDCRYLFELQLREGVREYFHEQRRPTWEQHFNWLNQSLQQKNRAIFLVMYKGERAGMVRLDYLSDTEAEISIIVEPALSGNGIGSNVISILKRGTVRKLWATIHKENRPSLRMFTGNGFVLASEQSTGFFQKYCFVGEHVRHQQSKTRVEG